MSCLHGVHVSSLFPCIIKKDESQEDIWMDERVKRKNECGDECWISVSVSVSVSQDKRSSIFDGTDRQ